MKPVIENRFFIINHTNPEDVADDRIRFEQRLNDAIASAELVPTSHPAVIQGLTTALNDALKLVAPIGRASTVRPGMKLNTTGYFSINVDWATAKWEIVGLD
ncbi:MAG: hypothetical protein OXD31_16255 [Chloroflexi bacterium]|nr:hypothetical protein [Chloroflexota bacterium]